MCNIHAIPTQCMVHPFCRIKSITESRGSKSINFSRIMRDRRDREQENVWLKLACGMSESNVCNSRNTVWHAKMSSSERNMWTSKHFLFMEVILLSQYFTFAGVCYNLKWGSIFPSVCLRQSVKLCNIPFPLSAIFWSSDKDIARYFCITCCVTRFPHTRSCYEVDNLFYAW